MKSIRLERIMDILRHRGYASVEELSRELGISKVTVRRDLSVLESQGLVERRRGGVFLKSFHHEIPFFLKLEKRKEKKMKIAEKVIDLLKDGQTIFATGGTTVYYAIQAIGRSSLVDLTFVTNSITTAWAVINLRKPFDLIHTGGSVRQGSFECVGGQVMSFVEKLNVDVFLMGVDGIDIEKGITFNSYEESVVAERVAANASRRIVLADDSKFGVVAPYRVVDIDGVDYIVTNESERTRKIRRFLEASGVNLVFA